MPRADVRQATGEARRPLWTAIVRLLEERASHGYELVARLNEAGTAADTVSVYRALRAMEGEGIVSSTWDVSQRGPARRVYVPTPAGHAVGS